MGTGGKWSPDFFAGCGFAELTNYLSMMEKLA